MQRNSSSMPLPVSAETRTAGQRGRRPRQRELESARHQVRFVQSHDYGESTRADLLEHLLDRLHLALHHRAGCIDHVDEQIGLGHLLQCGAEGRHQRRRQPLYESHRVGQEEFLAPRQARATRRRVKRSEEPVLCQHADAGQRVQQRGLACVGVADQGDDRRARALTTLSVQLSVRAHVFQFLFESVLLATQQAAVNFDLLFALTALLHAALLPGEVRPLAGQARQIVFDLGQFHLQASLARVRALGEDDENQGCPVEDLRLECSLQRAVLARGVSSRSKMTASQLW